MPTTRSAAGFTLLEIMVALTVGGIALGSLYAVGSASTRHFREQQRISSAQTALRSAMDNLKHDFQRAGFLSTPNTRLAGEACAEPTFAENRWIGAVNGFDRAVARPSHLDPDGYNKPELYFVDQVWLTGNYVTSGEYPNINVSADGLTVQIPMGWQSFQRDFADWDGANVGNCNTEAFQAAFASGRLVRLHSMSGLYFYSRIDTTTCAGDQFSNATVTLKDPLPISCNMDGGWIAPVNTLRYHVMDAAGTEDDASQRNTVLKRTEVQPENRVMPLQAVVGSELVNIEDRSLLDYVVRFSVNFLMLPIDAVKVSYVPMTAAEWLLNPERARGVVLDVAVRTSQQESNFTSQVDTASFIVHAGLGRARVRSMRAELLLPNIADRNR